LEVTVAMALPLRTALVVATIAPLLVAARVGAPATSVDDDFGDCGLVVVDGGYPYEEIVGLIEQEDARLVAAIGTAAFSSGLDDFAITRFLEDGSVDDGFGDDGTTVTDFPDAPGSDLPSELAVDLDEQPDGALIVSGNEQNSAEGASDFALARYTPDGALDATFGADGRVTTDLNLGDTLRAVAVGADGSIVAGGYTASGGASPVEVMVVRYTPDGIPDTTFGTDGIVTTGIGDYAAAESVVVQPDGMIVVLANTSDADNSDVVLVRYRPDGSIETGFGDAGFAVADLGTFPYGEVLVRQDDGGLVVGASVDSGARLVRFGPSGDPDSSFGDGGSAVVSLNGLPTYVSDIAAVGDDILVAASVSEGSISAFGLLRFDTDGALDADLAGTGGVATVFPAAENAMPRVVRALTDGRIVIAGSASESFSSDQDLALARYLADGRLDAFEDCAPSRLPVVIDRISGRDRFETAAAISADTFDPGLEVVFIATGADFPDALAGTPAAAAARAPMLLVTKDAVPDPTRVELLRLQPGRIVVLGGAAAVSDAVLTELGTLTTGSVTRLFGPGRIDTAVAISAATFAPGVAEVFLATAANFPDALAGGAMAGWLGSPVLLTEPSVVPDATLAELDRLQPGLITILGGDAAVSFDVDLQLFERYGEYPGRHSDTTRYGTAARISDAYPERFPDSEQRPGGGPIETVYIATGENYPDALAGGSPAALAGGRLLLVHPAGPTIALQQAIARIDPGRIVLLGGVAAIPDLVEDALGVPGALGFRYFFLQPDGTPIRYGCDPIHYVTNVTAAPAGQGVENVHTAVAQLEAAMGVDWVYDGPSDEIPQLTRESYQPAVYGDRWAPVLIAWAHPDDTDYPIGDGDFIGYGGSTFWHWIDGAVYVSGALVIDSAYAAAGNSVDWDGLLLHELGHVAGLDHVGDPAEIMFAQSDTTSSLRPPAAYQPGDRFGLSVAGTGSPCLANPSPHDIFG